MSSQQTDTQAKPTGAPTRNVNALKNGSKSFRLVIGDMPKTMHRQQLNALKYRRALEDAIRQLKGEVCLCDAHFVDVATQAEIHAAVCRWLLKSKLETMSSADIVTCSREILKAKEARNRAVQQLKLDETQANSFLALYAQDDSSITEEANNATDSKPRDEGGQCDESD